MNVPSPADVFASLFSAGHQAEAETGVVRYGPCDRVEPGVEGGAEPCRDYGGPELRSGTPEYEAEYVEYQAWVGQAEPESENQPVPYTLTPQAEALLDAARAEPDADAEPEAER